MLQLLNDIVNAPPPASYQRRSRKSKPEDEGRRARKKKTTRGQVSPIHEDDTRRHSDGATNIGRHRFDNETQRHPAAPGQLPRIMSARAPFSIDGPDLKAHHAEQLDLNCSDEEQTSQEQPLNATSSPPLPFSQEITGQMPAKKQNSHPRPRPQFASDPSGLAADYYDDGVSFDNPSLATDPGRNTLDLNASNSRKSKFMPVVLESGHPLQPIDTNRLSSQAHEHIYKSSKEPSRRVLHWWNDHEGVRNMKEYTEYIVKCKNCINKMPGHEIGPRNHHTHDFDLRTVQAILQKLLQPSGTISRDAELISKNESQHAAIQPHIRSTEVDNNNQQSGLTHAVKAHAKPRRKHVRNYVVDPDVSSSRRSDHTKKQPTSARQARGRVPLQRYRRRKFFNFINTSSSSIDSNLAYGEDYRALPRRDVSLLQHNRGIQNYPNTIFAGLSQAIKAFLGSNTLSTGFHDSSPNAFTHHSSKMYADERRRHWPDRSRDEDWESHTGSHESLLDYNSHTRAVVNETAGLSKQLNEATDSHSRADKNSAFIGDMKHPKQCSGREASRQSLLDEAITRVDHEGEAVGVEQSIARSSLSKRSTSLHSSLEIVLPISTSDPYHFEADKHFDVGKAKLRADQPVPHARTSSQTSSATCGSQNSIRWNQRQSHERLSGSRGRVRGAHDRRDKRHGSNAHLQNQGLHDEQDLTSGSCPHSQGPDDISDHDIHRKSHATEEIESNLYGYCESHMPNAEMANTDSSMTSVIQTSAAPAVVLQDLLHDFPQAASATADVFIQPEINASPTARNVDRANTYNVNDERDVRFRWSYETSLASPSRTEVFEDVHQALPNADVDHDGAQQEVPRRLEESSDYTDAVRTTSHSVLRGHNVNIQDIVLDSNKHTRVGLDGDSINQTGAEHGYHTRADNRSFTPDRTRDQEGGKQSMHQSHSPDEHVTHRDEDLGFSTSKRQQTGLSSLRIGNADEEDRNHAQQVDNNEPDISSPEVEAADGSIESKHIVPGAFQDPPDDSDEVTSDPVLSGERQEQPPKPEYAKGTSVLAQNSKVNPVQSLSLGAYLATA